MKHVNLDPELEKRKTEIMDQFNSNNGPEHEIQDSTTLTPDVTKSPESDSDQDEGAVSENELKERVIDALKTVYDPEIPVNIFDLGLIYKVEIKDRFVNIDMTLTAPGCPVAHTFPGMVERSVALVAGVDGAAVELVWDPPWTPDLISEAARLELGLI